MGSDERTKKDELRWEAERLSKQDELFSKLAALFPAFSYSFVPFPESDQIMLSLAPRTVVIFKFLYVVENDHHHFFLHPHALP